MEKKWTGERLETSVFSRDTSDHLHRYALTLDYIKDKIVLDIACGEGYGSNLMSKHAKFVYGVDVDNKTVLNASNKYVRENLKFLTGSASKIPIESNSIDILVSFETLEHHNEHEQMMMEIKRVLKPTGILIISTPDKYYYSDVRNFKNKFHIKELYKKEFLQLVSTHFSFYQLLNQAHVNGSSIICENEEINKIKFFKGDYSKIEVVENDLTYLIMIASNFEFLKNQITIFDGIEVNKQIMITLENQYRNSSTFKLGRFILFPFFFIKRFLNKC